MASLFSSQIPVLEVILAQDKCRRNSHVNVNAHAFMCAHFLCACMQRMFVSSLDNHTSHTSALYPWLNTASSVPLRLSDTAASRLVYVGPTQLRMLRNSSKFSCSFGSVLGMVDKYWLLSMKAWVLIVRATAPSL